MYLSRLTLNRSRLAVLWLTNPYRVHQRLMMGCENDPRLLFRIEETEAGTYILVQTHSAPQWPLAFDNFTALARPPEVKSFDLALREGGRYHFRLLANPTVKKTVPAEDNPRHKTRLGLVQAEDQLAWLQRKLDAAGAGLLDCQINPRGLQHTRKNATKDPRSQTHLSVLFEGQLLCHDSQRMTEAVGLGFGAAKGYGFGLLSLARVE